MCVLCVFLSVVLFSSCYSSDVFHEGSKVTFYPNYNADFFGYTVVFGESSLIVGAPKAYEPASMNQTGVVFSCPTDDLGKRNVSCQPMSLDRNVLGGRRDFHRNDMWFGASIAVAPTGKLLVCGPRWADPYQDSHLLANGVCLLHTKRRSIPLYPLKDRGTTNQAFMSNGARKEYGEYGTHLNYYAYGQAGMSVKVTDRGFIIGAPGLLQWTGGIVEYSYNTDVNSYSSNRKPVMNPFYTRDVGPDDYLGYSVESGVFEDGGKTLFVAGAPRAKQGFGQVLVFEPGTYTTSSLKIQAKLEGPQLGAYFGASLVCLDINSDGRTDLIVGAPNYVGAGEAVYDQGAVFVYLNKEQSTGFILDYAGQVRGSEAVRARFGTAIAELGDIDGDGYKDIAISAPWESDGKGAVYIYRGDRQGLRSQYVQRIMASEAGGFGMSIAKGHDIDGNKCNDLAIGAHATGTAYIYRCMPTVHVTSHIKIPKAMDLPQNTTNFTAMFCFNVAPELHWPHVEIKMKAKITVDPENNRAMISGDAEYTITAKPGIDSCDEQVVEVKPTADLSRPIAITFDLEPIDIIQKNATTFLPNAARLSDDSTLHSEFDIQLTRDCGEDLICRPWLQMTMEALDDPYVPGTETRLGALITVLNKEEPAYGIQVHLTLPALPKRVPKKCNLQGLNMTCQLPNPLYRNHSVKWEVGLEYALNLTDEEELYIDAVLEDPVFNRNVSDEAAQDLIMVISPEANFNISGKALPNATVAVSRDKLSEGSHVAFMHYFEVTNTGPSDWLVLDARLHLPEHVSLATPIEGCTADFNATILECTWSVPANVSLPIVLGMRFDLKTNGKVLEEHTTRDATTMLLLYEQNKTASITTRLVLDPSFPIWPPIVGTIAGILLLSVIIYVLHKYGFFSRNRYEKYKELQRSESLQNLPSSSGNPGSSQESPGDQPRDPSSSSSTLATSPEESAQHESSQKLLLETDSD